MKAREENESLRMMNVDLEAEIKNHVANSNHLKETLRLKEREFVDAQAQLATTKEELSGAMASLQAPIRINNQEGW